MAVEEQPPVDVNPNEQNYVKQGSLTTKRCDCSAKGVKADLFARHKDKDKKKQTLRNNEYYDMQPVLDRLYQQSTEGKNFNELLDIITSKNNILLAYRNIKGNKGSRTSGVDKVNIEGIKATETNMLVDKIQKMFANYTPGRVKRVEIPKEDGSGKTRPLGIPTMSDRLFQQCILQVLEPICEAKFSDNSYGFRPNRSCENAVSKAMMCMQQKYMHFCVDIDIKGFFDNVNHGKLLKQMWTLGIQDKSLLCIISKILKSEIVMPNGDILKSDKGTPQGGIISPLLSNIVLNELDWWINKQWSLKEMKEVKPNIMKTGQRNRGNEYRRMRKQTTLKEMHIVRYADDFKIFTNDYPTALKIFTAVKLWLKDRLDLDISPEKSKITNLRKNYTVFLGFKLKLHKKGEKQVVKSNISDKARKKIIKTLVEQVKTIQRSKDVRADLWQYNSKVLGFHNFYQIATHGNLDFGAIAFIVSKSLNHKLRPKRSGTATGYVKDRYGESKQLRFVGETPIIPIGYVQHKNPMDKKKTINNFTAEGRAEIHKNLEHVNMAVLRYLMENVPTGKNVEFYTNRIALYSGQNGKCYITGQSLEIGNIHCHHKIPRNVKVDNSYSNLVLITIDSHRLLHATKAETIAEYTERLNPDKKQLARINKLRKILNLPNL